MAVGRTDLNVLCVGLVYQGVSIPLAYQSLQKPGNANTSERKRLLTKGLAYLDPRVCCLVADREFIGRAWFAFLLEQPITTIRVVVIEILLGLDRFRVVKFQNRTSAAAATAMLGDLPSSGSSFRRAEQPVPLQGYKHT